MMIQASAVSRRKRDGRRRSHCICPRRNHPSFPDILHLLPLPLSPHGPRPSMFCDPKSRGSPSEDTNYSDSGYAPSSLSAPRMRQSLASPSLPSLQTALRHPRVLECLLSLLSYGAFNALTSSCLELRNLMQKPALKDVILSRFLPGFRSLLRSKAPELFIDVRATISDLNIFRASSFPYFTFLDPDAHDKCRSLE